MPEEYGAQDHIRKEFPSVSPGAKFLHERNQSLHASPEVEHAVTYLRDNGEQIPNQPAQKIEHYLGFLANRDYVNDGILTGNQTSIDRQIEAHVIKAGDVPEAYFELQRRIAREQGQGEVTITDEARHQLTEAIQADQRAALETWVEYLGGDDGSYPDWFKYYVWNSIIKLGSFDKEKGEFQRRSKGTTAAYPELNREALAYVFDNLNKRVNGENVEGSEKLKQLLDNTNFGKLYAYAVLEISPDSPELKNTILGSWTKYDQTDDPRTSRRLAGSLQGHGTGWCTAGESTAETQLKKGDFYVYYTRGEDGKDVVPRIAIRMENGQVREVRGVNPQQELEPDLYDITLDKLKDLPGGEAYLKRANDMKRLTALDNKLKTDPNAELSKDEISFLYELDGFIEGFGYAKDPRVSELRDNRDVVLDMAKLFDVNPDDRVGLIKTLASSRQKAWQVLDQIIDRTQGLSDEVARYLLDSGKLYSVTNHFSSFSGLGDEVARSVLGNINIDNLMYFSKLSEDTYLKLLSERAGGGYGGYIWTWLANADKFNITDPKKIADLLISRDMWEAVARLPEFFPNIDHMAIARQLIEAGKAHYLSPGYYTELDDKVFADAWLEHDPPNLASWLDELKVDKNEYIRELIRRGKIGDLAARLRSLQGVDEELAEQIRAEREKERQQRQDNEKPLSDEERKAYDERMEAMRQKYGP